MNSIKNVYKTLTKVLPRLYNYSTFAPYSVFQIKNAKKRPPLPVGEYSPITFDTPTHANRGGEL